MPRYGMKATASGFLSLADARDRIEAWTTLYNEERLTRLRGV
jgi:hypothetical protein